MIVLFNVFVETDAFFQDSSVLQSSIYLKLNVSHFFKLI